MESVKAVDEYLNGIYIMMGISALMVLLSIFLMYMGYQVARDITRNIESLENTLIHAAQKLGSKSDLEKMPKIDLDTTKGTIDAHNFLETLIEKAEIDKNQAEEANEAKPPM